MLFLSMEDYKKQFIEFLYETGALRIGEFKTKAGRLTPIYIDTKYLHTGKNSSKLGEFCVNKLENYFKSKNIELKDKLEDCVIFGPSYKGSPIAQAISMTLSNEPYKIDTRFAYNRKEAKYHGEGTYQEPSEEWILGVIENEDKILIVDDVISTGDTKYESIKLLDNIYSNLEYIGLHTLVDKQEVNNDGKNALQELKRKMKMPISYHINATDIVNYSWGIISESTRRRFKEYYEGCGTDEIKNFLRSI